MKSFEGDVGSGWFWEEHAEAIANTKALRQKHCGMRKGEKEGQAKETRWGGQERSMIR